MFCARGIGSTGEKVRGVGYSASDPAAQLWVLATLIQCSVTQYQNIPEHLRQRLGLQESKLKDPLWRCFDKAIPWILRWGPKRLRYPAQYIAICG